MSPPADHGPRYWHGGGPGRHPGDRLLPPAETGLSYTRRDISLEEGLRHIAQRLDRVYLTTDRELARAWAGIWTLDGVRHGGGSLYRVEPVGEVEPDDDLLSLPGVSVQVKAAIVVSVYDAHVPYHPRYLRDLQRILDAHAEARRKREGGSVTKD